MLLSQLTKPNELPKFVFEFWSQSLVLFTL
jgi:hypothetical protein